MKEILSNSVPTLWVHNRKLFLLDHKECFPPNFFRDIRAQIIRKETQKALPDKCVSLNNCVGGQGMEVNPIFLGKKMSESFSVSNTSSVERLYMQSGVMYRKIILEPHRNKKKKV